MRIFAGWATSILFFVLGVQTPPSQANAPVVERNTPVVERKDPGKEQLLQQLAKLERRTTTTTTPAPIFAHGNIDWLTELATQAGWPKKTHKKLGQIILRESGGCPNRLGGDKVNKGCDITGVSEWNHRSDTGLLQINGVNYDLSRNKWARVCLDLGICTQEPLLDPLTNLKAGYLLYKYSGWSPWDPCTWDKTRCPKKKP